MLLLRDLPRFETLLAMSEQYPGLDPSAVECCLVLRRVAADLVAAMGRHYAAHGTSGGRFVMLLMLDAASKEGQGERPAAGLSPTELAGRAGVTRATVSGLLRGLERDGLVVREPDPSDLRGATIRLSGAGSTFLRAMLPDHFRRMAGVAAGLSAGERAQLVALLRKVGGGLAALDPGGPGGRGADEQRTESAG